MKLEKTVLGYPIWVEIHRLDCGWDIGIYGGCSTHVGAVTLAEPDGTVQTLERSGHKDSFISTRWAAELAAHWSAPVCVRCGIHYDNVMKAQLAEITAVCDAMLLQLMTVPELERKI